MCYRAIQVLVLVGGGWGEGDGALFCVLGQFRFKSWLKGGGHCIVLLGNSGLSPGWRGALYYVLGQFTMSPSTRHTCINGKWTLHPICRWGGGGEEGVENCTPTPRCFMQEKPGLSASHKGTKTTKLKHRPHLLATQHTDAEYWKVNS